MRAEHEWRGKLMVNNNHTKANQEGNIRDASSLIQRINDAVNIAIEQYQSENPSVDVESLLSEHDRLLYTLGVSSNRELDRFVAYAKDQGTKMPFDAMEMGVLVAGRKDMQNGLAEILDSIGFDKPVCSECHEKMDNRGRSKKKF
jgi:predicted lactoylglutathione lyase